MNPPTPLETADNVDDAKPKQLAVPVPPATSATTGDVPDFGWSAYAERVNGRFAMLGFSAVVLIETLSRDSFLHWAGLVP
jgi:cell division protein FtsN